MLLNFKKITITLFLFLVFIVSLFSIVGILYIYSSNQSFKDEFKSSFSDKINAVDNNVTSDSAYQINSGSTNFFKNIYSDFIIKSRHLNFLLYGVDEKGTRTDLILVGTIDATDGELSIISLYRDTFTTLTDTNVNLLNQKNYYYPYDKNLKLNQVYHYGKDIGHTLLVNQIEETLNIKIDYYGKVDFQGFIEIIDDIGGIDYDVPSRMYYNDPTQNLVIDLDMGLQNLSGYDAMGLLRYRKSDLKNPLSKGYSNGDIGRVYVQQDFLKHLLKTLISTETIMSNFTDYLYFALNRIETNIKFWDIPELLAYVLTLDENELEYSIKMYTISGTTKSILGQSYFLQDEDNLKKLVREIFYDR